MRKIIILAAVMACVPIVAGAQTGTTKTDPTTTDTSRIGQPSNPNTTPSGPKDSTSSRNTPTTGEPAGRNNPSVSRAPDTAPSRGTSRQ